ncbi:MAG: HAD-IA family hydrolase [Candidatus Nealsonbacteria bacterium]|nr:HAD-IA family hydrolase [Candidatus Nealsonbacteria bacterium]
MIKEIKHLIFDLGGVIILKGSFDFKTFDKKYSLPPGKTREVMSSCFKILSLDETVNLKQHIEDNFAPLFNFKKFKEVVEKLAEKEKVNERLLSWLKEKRGKYPVSLLTNNTSKLDDVLKDKFEIYDEFDHIFNSADIGFRKPDPRIFDYLLEALETKAEECLFVDDNALNVEQAGSMGFLAFLFKNNESFFKEIKELNL